jgi:putative two-component system response regulator
VDLSLPKQTGDVRIAAADDDETVLRLIGQTLSKAGFRIAAMKSGRALLKYVSEQKPDLILLDTAMPEQDGFETLQLLRGLKGAAEIPVILLTEDNAPETDRRCLSLGADEIIRKPVVPEILVHRVRHVTELAARRGASHASR